MRWLAPMLLFVSACSVNTSGLKTQDSSPPVDAFRDGGADRTVNDAAQDATIDSGYDAAKDSGAPDASVNDAAKDSGAECLSGARHFRVDHGMACNVEDVLSEDGQSAGLTGDTTFTADSVPVSACLEIDTRRRETGEFSVIARNTDAACGGSCDSCDTGNRIAVFLRAEPAGSGTIRFHQYVDIGSEFVEYRADPAAPYQYVIVCRDAVDDTYGDPEFDFVGRPECR